MRKCACCGRLLEDEMFGKNRRTKDGLQAYCRECQKLFSLGYKANAVRFRMIDWLPVKSEDNFACSGIKISILNHAKPGEKIYNILNLNKGLKQAFNDKEQFFLSLEKMLGR